MSATGWWSVHPAVPPMVEYASTPMGRSPAALGLDLGRWAADHEEAIDSGRTSFERETEG